MDEENRINEPQNEEKRVVNYNTNYNTNYNNDKKSKKSGCFYAFILGLVALVGVIVIFCGMIGAVASIFESDTIAEEYNNYPYVGFIDISGTIQESYDGYPVDGTYSHTWVLDCVDSYAEDDYNKAIILYINSPGGGIYESDELYNKLMDYKEETGRPVFAYMAQEAASGGLYVAMAADEIAANRMTLTGSIGVIMSSMDLTGLYEKLGIETRDITSGENKDMFTGMNDEQRAILQQMIDEYYGYFVEVVSDSRSLDEDYVRKISDGRVYTATQAKELGLIDSIMTYDEFVDYVLDKPELQDCDIFSYEYINDDFMSYVLRYIGFKSDVSEPSALTEVKELMNKGKISAEFK